MPTSGWLLRTFLTVLGSCSCSSSSRSEAGTSEEGTDSTPVPGRALQSSCSQLMSSPLLFPRPVGHEDEVAEVSVPLRPLRVRSKLLHPPGAPIIIIIIIIIVIIIIIIIIITWRTSPGSPGTCPGVPPEPPRIGRGLLRAGRRRL